ncbi:hypothetical protein GVAMD_0969 [Gardnerella vaginalis AMD]|nr:hypothetical protein GVAMD_0969 [Gardnerella vaginalis AMD]
MINRVRIDLMEHRLFRKTKVVITLTVKLVAIDTTEIADTRQSQSEQTIQEFPHTIATKSYVSTDSLTFAQMELSDRLLCLSYLWLLAGNQSEILNRTFDELRITSCSADAHRDDNLLHASHLHRISVAEFFLQGWYDFILVLLL